MDKAGADKDNVADMAIASKMAIEANAANEASNEANKADEADKAN